MGAFNARIKHKKDTHENWTTNDPVLLDGELILVAIDGTVMFKVGDGVSHYTSLDFISSSPSNFVTEEDIDAMFAGTYGDGSNSDQVPTTIIFYIDWMEYIAIEGMTWAEWIVSDYYDNYFDTIFVDSINDDVICVDDNSMVVYPDGGSQIAVHGDDVIVANVEYMTAPLQNDPFDQI